MLTGIDPTLGAQMSRKTGDRYKCEQCGAAIVYEQACPCPPEMEHKEICCGKQMTLVSEGER